MLFLPFNFRRISLLGIRDIKAAVYNLYCGRLVSAAASPTGAVSGAGLKVRQHFFEGVLNMPVHCSTQRYHFYNKNSMYVKVF